MEGSMEGVHITARARVIAKVRASLALGASANNLGKTSSTHDRRHVASRNDNSYRATALPSKYSSSVLRLDSSH